MNIIESIAVATVRTLLAVSIILAVPVLLVVGLR